MLDEILVLGWNSGAMLETCVSFVSMVVCQLYQHLRDHETIVHQNHIYSIMSHSHSIRYDKISSGNKIARRRLGSV